MDYMDLAVGCPREAAKRNPSLAMVLSTWHKQVLVLPGEGS